MSIKSKCKSKYDFGIITFYNANNYGAILQTYALQAFLKRNGFTSCIIRSRWQRHNFPKTLRSLLYHMSHCFFDASKRVKFNHFLKANCSLSKKYNLKKYNCINGICKHIVIGSDQVWNKKWNNNSDFFYAPFAQNKYSYAASFGSVSYLSDIDKKIIFHDISQFNAVSVREKDASIFLHSLGINNDVHIDPVFLIDNEQWSIIAKQKNNYGDYVLVYSLEDNPNLYQHAKKVAAEKNMNVVLITDSIKKTIDGMIVASYLSPAEFVAFFKNASYVTTNSFHGVAFSIIFNKHFSVFLQNSRNAPNNRIIDLLEMFNMKDRIFNNEEPLNHSYYEIKHIISSKANKSLAYFDRINNGFFDKSKAGNNSSFNFYLCKSKNHIDIEKSRSGAIAYTLCKNMISNGGVVYGVILKEGTVVMDRITTLKELELIRNSKYVDPVIKGVFAQIKNDLINSKKVIVSALPCQTSALCAFLRFNNICSDNLIIIDFACHGVTDKKYFDKYLLEISNKYNGKVESFNFRDKHYGWDNHVESFYVNGRKKKSKVYARLFSNNLTLMERCYNCHFDLSNKESDITICDAWGYVKNKKDKKTGINMVITNNDKGKNYLNAIRNDIELEIIKRIHFVQPCLLGCCAKPKDKELFDSVYQEKGLIAAYKTFERKFMKVEWVEKVKANILKILRVFLR